MGRRAGEAMDEAALVLSGLVETDPDAWQKVADMYLRGSYSPSQNPTFDPASGTWKSHLTVSFNLQVWDGRGEPRPDMEGSLFIRGAKAGFRPTSRFRPCAARPSGFLPPAARFAIQTGPKRH